MATKIQLTFLFVCFTFLLSAQSRFLRRGEKAFVKNHYAEAIANFKNVKNKNPEINRKIAESYYFLGDYQEAESYYQKIYDSEKSADDLLALSHIYLNSEKYIDAILCCERAAIKGADQVLIDKRIKAIQELHKNDDYSGMILRSIDPQPKSKSMGLSVVGNKIIYSNLSKKNARGDKRYQLFYSEFADQRYSEVKLWSNQLDNTVDLGAVAVPGDEKTMYYTCWYTRKGRQYMEIVQAEFKNNKWKASFVLPFNGRKYSCAYPFLTKDGKSLYFSSDMPGGYGGMDLYVCHKRGKSWGVPINLGEEINTQHHEIYPSLLKDGKLWFASDGQVGYGRLDLFYASKTKEGKWGEVKNAGVGLNSSLNDFSIQDSPEKGQLLFVSDRNNNGIRDRIYSFGADRKIPVELLVKEESSKEPVSNAKIEVKKVLSDQIIVPQQISADKFQFEVSCYELGKGLLYEINAEKQGYENAHLKFYPVESNLSVDILLEKLKKNMVEGFVKELTPIHYPDKRMIFRKIHFDAGQESLSSEAKVTLSKMAGFWKIYPELGIVINSHTDSKGAAESNRVLSMKRAKMAKEFMVAKGVDSSRIICNAYGERFVVNGCIDGMDCSEELHRQNRRLELLFVIK
ncbi:OmpA family protein [Marinifilum sp. D714]|uniref:OmpA family protein n=1 Tax=Marinifilum sp. D714 TaxID=2937523 RepID=UPI0027CF4974|nr:OmpA family protein [Marinifilum sp. D714]MDQ2179833.1 OmpA family protein [Marinifilum sp. D714]